MRYDLSAGVVLSSDALINRVSPSAAIVLWQDFDPRSQLVPVKARYSTTCQIVTIRTVDATSNINFPSCKDMEMTDAVS
ncbi:hypothetical protein A0H81_09732 [Grifola frondosa]|uniref:Uncharacterized protein n=1 Tax=Grifola frondosa TaxID=5627 RepID=A0A1C7LZS9_GRIFR|nr:hypothetical protein A0H81_09732 [Grifola frondosa]